MDRPTMDEHVSEESARQIAIDDGTVAELTPSMQVLHRLIEDDGLAPEAAAIQLPKELRRLIEERYPLKFQQHWTSLEKYIDDALVFLADSFVMFAVTLAEMHPEVTLEGGYTGQINRIRKGLQDLKLQTKYDMIVALDEREAREEEE